MNNATKTIIATLIAVGAIFGAIQIYNHSTRPTEPGDRQTQSRSEELHDVDFPDGLRAPESYRFGRGSVVIPANDYRELLARYSHDDRSVVENFYAGYGGAATALPAPRFQHAFDFHDAKQLEWLVANGYPTPDDIIEANRLTDSELAKRVAQGNFKAKVFYLNRLQATPRQEGTTPGEEVRFESNEMDLAVQLFRSGSPFGALAYSHWADSSRHPELAAASLSFARKLGDSRREFLDGYVAIHPEMDPATLANAYELILALTRRSPYIRDMEALSRRPKFPLAP